MVFHTKFDIRTYHTDGFGHVNNARYLELLEEARWQFSDHIELTGMLRESNLGFIIVEMGIRFRASVVEGNRISVDTSLITLGSASGEVLQVVRKNGEASIATRCLSHFILIDRDDSRSVPIDGKIRQLLLEIIEPARATAQSMG